jgi:hypothetical protein
MLSDPRTTRSPTPPVHDPLVSIWLAIGLVFALFVGTGAGVLSWLSSQSIATGVLIGGASFGGTVTLIVLVINLLRR